MKYIILFLCILSCSSQKDKAYKDALVKYIIFLTSEKISFQKVIVSVKEQHSLDNQYLAYRISAGRPYLYLDEIPNDYFFIKYYLVLDYTARETCNKERAKEYLNSKEFPDALRRRLAFDGTHFFKGLVLHDTSYTLGRGGSFWMAFYFLFKDNYL